MCIMLKLVVCAFLPVVLYSIPIGEEKGQHMAPRKNIKQGVSKLQLGYDRSKPNPEELGGYYEGDIVLRREPGRNGLMAPQYRWPNRTIPFVILGNFTINETLTIEEALALYRKYTCLSFSEKLPDDNDYVTISNFAEGCWSNVGRQGGNQTMNLQSPDCVIKVGTVVHEMMHVAGFVHELTRYDRDDYVEINWDNVNEDQKHNFKKQREGEIDEYGVTYDYNSVMHYSRFAFTINKEVPSVIPKYCSKAKNMGQRLGFSIKDITKVNLMYKCPEKTQVAWDEHHKRKPEVCINEYIFNE